MSILLRALLAEDGESVHHNNTENKHGSEHHGSEHGCHAGHDETVASWELLIVIALLVGAIIQTLQRYYNFFCGIEGLCKILQPFFNLPYTFFMLLFGLIFAAITQKHDMLKKLEFDHEVILFILLPPLLLEDTITIDIHKFKKLAKSSLFLAFPGVIVAGGLSALLLWPMYPEYSPSVLLLIGYMLSATDPVAVVNALNSLGAPSKLSTLIAGESLLNDGSAYVLFQVLSLIAYPKPGAPPVTVGSVMISLVLLLIVGPLWGYVAGLLTSLWLSAVSCPYLETTLLVCGAYAVFLIGDHYIHSSGVLCTVTYGLYMASAGQWNFSPEGLEHTHQILGQLGHVCTSLIFVFAGYFVAYNLDAVTGMDGLYLLLIYLGLTVIRALVVFGSRPLLSSKKMSPYGLTVKESIIVVWGGLRGAVGLSLGMILEVDPCVDPDQSEKINFLLAGMVILTIFVNGTTTSYLYNWLQVYKDSSEWKNNIIKAAKEEICEHVEEHGQDKIMKDWFLCRAYWPSVKKLATVKELVVPNDESDHHIGEARKEFHKKIYTAAANNDIEWFQKELDEKKISNTDQEALAALYMACNLEHGDIVTKMTENGPVAKEEKKTIEKKENIDPAADFARAQTILQEKREKKSLWSLLSHNLVVTYFHGIVAHYKHQFDENYVSKESLILLLDAADRATDKVNEEDQELSPTSTTLLKGALEAEWNEIDAHFITAQTGHSGWYKELAAVGFKIETLAAYIRAHSFAISKIHETQHALDENNDGFKRQLIILKSYDRRAKLKLIKTLLEESAESNKNSQKVQNIIEVLAARVVLRSAWEKVNEMDEEGFLLPGWADKLGDDITDRDKALEHYRIGLQKHSFATLGPKVINSTVPSAVVDSQKKILALEKKYYQQETKKVKDVVVKTRYALISNPCCQGLKHEDIGTTQNPDIKLKKKSSLWTTIVYMSHNDGGTWNIYRIKGHTPGGVAKIKGNKDLMLKPTLKREESYKIHKAKTRKRSMMEQDREILEKMQGANGVSIKDRKWKLKTYPQCFIGKEFVTWMIEQKIAENRVSAVKIGERLRENGAIHHITNLHSFKDEDIFYAITKKNESIELVALQDDSPLIATETKTRTDLPVTVHTPKQVVL